MSVMVSFEYMGFDVDASIISGDTCSTDKGPIHYAPYIDELTVQCNGHQVNHMLSDTALEVIESEAIRHAV